MRSSVEADRGEAPSLELPVGVGHGDLAPLAGDEVPPHEDLLVEGRAAEQEYTGTVAEVERNNRRPRSDVDELVGRCLGARDARRSVEDEDPCSNVGSRGR